MQMPLHQPQQIDYLLKQFLELRSPTFSGEKDFIELAKFLAEVKKRFRAMDF